LAKGATVRIFVSRIFILALLAAMVLCRSAWAPTGSLALAGVTILALALAAIGMAGRMWCSVYIAGRKNVELVTTGPYSVCRHPLYFFSFVGALGIALASGTVTLPTLLAVAFLIYYPAVFAQEEVTLKKRHGEAFTAYQGRVRAFWPRWQRPTSDAQMTVHPAIFFNHLGSAIWFPILVGVVLLLGHLREVCGLTMGWTLF
jgi:protein-S-isoprenylcysteine O-methyltransferase Ste14